VKVAPGVRIGPYEVMEQVGRGGMATVFKAYHHALERMVAIKVLPDVLAEDPEFKERFRREAIAIARLRHPSILTVFDHGEFDGQPYIVTEFVEGGTFAHELGKPIAMQRAKEVLAAVASALDYAHGNGVLHRDVKPSNILMTKDGKSVLGDFGLARMMASNQRLTRLDMVVGTPEYMSPEQCAAGDAGPASDQYSLGVVAFEALTGHPPFHAETPAAVMLAQMRTPLPPPKTVNPDLSQPVEKALIRVLAKEPAERFPSCEAFVDALTADATTAVAAVPKIAKTIEQPKPMPVAATSTPSAPPRIPPRLLAIGAAAVAAVLVLGGAGYAIAASRGNHTNGNGSTTPAGSVSTGPSHGSLIYDASKAKSVWGDEEPSPDPAGSLTYSYSSNIDLKIVKETSVYAAFDAPALKNYVSHLIFHVDKGSDFYFDFEVRGRGANETADMYVSIDIPEETITLWLAPDGADNVRLTPALPISGVQGGKTIDIGLAVNDKTTTIYVDGKQVANVTETRSTGATEPAIYVNGKSGGLHIESLRYYAVK
jgi:serine/threonine protein kinase